MRVRYIICKPWFVLYIATGLDPALLRGMRNIILWRWLSFFICGRTWFVSGYRPCKEDA